MLQPVQSAIPVEWRSVLEIVGAPLFWLPEWQAGVIQFSLFGTTVLDAALRQLFLLLPALLVVVGLWTTLLALYTMPFRADRARFVTTLAMSWWDTGRSIWFFWSGVVRLVVLLAGWVWGLIRLAARMVVNAAKGAFQSPFVMLDWTSRRYFKPGVPWIAFLLTLGWSALEATIFTYTLLPTLIEVLSNITGFEPNRAVVTPILWLLLVMLIAGSFACIDVLTQAIQGKKAGQIVQMLFVEFFVMFFEVVFLYRELVDAITPWIAQQSGGQVQLGLVATLGLAGFAWVGIRGMTWFLFGRYGTSALLAVVSRQTITQDDTEPAVHLPPQPAVFKEAVAALKTEIAWFKSEGRHVFELLTLPVLQLLAAAVNFAVVLVRSRPVFTLPFRDLDAVMTATPFATGTETTRATLRSSGGAR